MAAYDFPDTAGKPTDGSFEYTAPDGTLYEWNGYAWVVPTDESGGGSGGAARVLTQVLPPSPAEDGDMYWCTDDGRLYLYYDDADTKQWVDASPDGGGNNVEKLIAGDNITLSPADGKGVVTINSTGGGSGGPTTPGVRYQQGTWTPVSGGGLTHGNVTWSRVGQTVTVAAIVTGKNNGETGQLKITGLPYPIIGNQCVGSCMAQMIDPAPTSAYTQATGNSLLFYNSSSNIWQGTALEQFAAVNSNIYYEATYITDDTTFVPSTGTVVTEDIQGTGGSGGGGGTTVNYNGTSAWGNVALKESDGPCVINGNLNIESVTRNGQGFYDVVFTTPMANDSYSVQATATDARSLNTGIYNQTTTGFRVSTYSITTDSVADIGFSFAVHSENAIAPQSGVGADAWGDVASDGTLNNGFNIQKIVYNSTGDYTAHFATPMASTNYGVASSAGDGIFVTKAKFTDKFNYETVNVTGTNTDMSAAFTVHASSTVTPTYTWTRNGTRLEPANAGDDVGSSGGLSDTDTSWRISGEGQIDSWGSAGYGLTIADTSSGSAQETIVLNRDGSATFAKNKTQFFSNGGFATYPSTSDTATRVRVIYSGPTEQAAVSIEGNGQASSNAILVKQIGGTDKVIVRHDGSAVFKGGVTPSNVFFNLEADDDTKYTSTTDADGNETLVYNGATLDVKALLLTLQTAAARIATLEAKVQTLESDHTTLMNNNNNNGGGY